MNYPAANVWTRSELDVEPEPEMVATTWKLSLPASWAPERRVAFATNWIGSDAVAEVSV